MNGSQNWTESLEEAVDFALATLGKRIVVGAPLGIGKPNQLLNVLYRRAVADPGIELTLITALSPEKPRARSALEARLLDPMVERWFGDYAELEYMTAIRARKLPGNVRVHEFYFPAGSMLGVASAQRDYISTNYTFAARDLLDRGVNLMVQMVALGEVDGRAMLSLASNTDISLDLLAQREQRRRSGGSPLLAIAQVHERMPFMLNRALVEPGCFDRVVSNRAYDTRLFAPPNQAVSRVDHAIALQASTLVRDGGTLQIGIGSLGDAIAHACLVRQRNNDCYRKAITDLGHNEVLVRTEGGLDRFERGLYGCSEMLVNGFLYLMEAGVVRREVYEDEALQRLANDSLLGEVPDAQLLARLHGLGAIGAVLSAGDVDYLRRWGIFREEVEWRDGYLWRGEAHCPASIDDAALTTLALGERVRGGICMHGGFFLGPEDFYQRLRELPRGQLERIGMDSVRRINRIDQPVLRELQRRDARFMNTGMMVTLSGAIVSDALENGQVVSGVGGQYNFVAQAHELPGARALICIRATRGEGKTLQSNIVVRYAHQTVPRHLRDIVVTEYGVADLRSRSDEEIIRALLNVADSRFQPQLLDAACKAGKIDPAYRIPAHFRNNLPARIDTVLGAPELAGLFPAFPFGNDFTPAEIALQQALGSLQSLFGRPLQLAADLLRFSTAEERAHEQELLQRIGLDRPRGWRERLLRRLLGAQIRRQKFALTVD